MSAVGGQKNTIAGLSIPRGAAPTRRRGRAWRWLAILVAVVLASLALGRFLLHPVVLVRTATASLVHPSRGFTLLNASGYVVAQRKAAVASKASGRLVWLGVEEGSRVREGQVLARLENDDLVAAQAGAAAQRDAARANLEVALADRGVAAANRDAARAGREESLARRDAARANRDAADADADEAAAELRRQEELLKGGFVPPAEVEAAGRRHLRAAAGSRAAVASLAAAEETAAAAAAAAAAAESAILAVESRVASARHSLAAAEASLRGAAVATGQTEIRAPFQGVVLTKNADLGDLVTPVSSAASARSAVVTMADLSSLLVEADVAEGSLRLVQAGQPCLVQLDAIPDARLSGLVHAVVPTADRAKGTVLVKIRFREPDPRVLPEMSAKVSFLARPLAPGEETPRVAVPPGAVVTRAAGRAVFILRGDRVEERAVETGAALDDLLEVVRGLQGGERVALDPPGKLRDGSRVRVVGE